MTRRVLVTDCWTRKALSVVRSLGEAGFTVYAVSHTRLGAALYSRHVDNYSILRSPEKDPRGYWMELSELLAQWNFECIIPLEEESIEIILNNKEHIPDNTKTQYIDADSYHRASDKWKVYQLATDLNIPVPISIAPDSHSASLKFSQEHGFPLILKPRSGRGSVGIVKLKDQKDLDAFYSRSKSASENYILQQKIDSKGPGLGVACLVKDGITLTSFSYKRLREYPVNGGPSTLRESTDHQEIIQHAERLLMELKWTGIAMVEFKFDPEDNKAKLLEINPRFWGSLELAHQSGINFPSLLCEMLSGQEVGKQSYEIGKRNRWLIPGDIMHFLASKNRFSMSPSFFNFFAKNTSYDQLSWSDFQGSLATIVCTFLSAFKIETWRKGVFRK